MVLDCQNKPKKTVEWSICRYVEMACDCSARGPHAQLVPP